MVNIFKSFLKKDNRTPLDNHPVRIITYVNIDEIAEKELVSQDNDKCLKAEKTADEIIMIEIERLRRLSQDRVSLQAGALGIPSLEQKAWNRISKLSRSIPEKDIGRIKSKTFGIIPLLTFGELQFALNFEMLKSKRIVSAVMQPFCSATELMIYVTFILYASEEKLKKYIRSESGDPRYRPGVYSLTEEFEMKAIIPVLNDYRRLRNLVAHTYQEIPIEAGRSLIQRTYENIQRLELIANP